MISETKLNSTFAYMRNIVDQDKTINTENYPWEEYSLAYTVYDSDSNVGQRISEQYLGEGRSQTPVQLVGLASIISPILRIGDQISSSVEGYHIVLDAKTWERPRVQLESIIQSIEWAPTVEFTIRGSNQTPGIQLADIAAYARRKRLQDGKCHLAMRYLSRLLL